MANRKRYIVRNGASVAGFSKRAIDDMKMLNLIQFRCTRQEPNGVVYIYTAAFDNRKVV